MKLTHIDERGRARMVNVGSKEDTGRTAVARGTVRMQKETVALISEGLVKKGDVLSAARIAGIMGAKKTSDIIPMCHNIFLSCVEISFQAGEDVIYIEARTGTYGKTGVEMEALTAVSAAALTIYDMCKAVDRYISIDDIHLVKKTGGKSGDYYSPDYK